MTDRLALAVIPGVGWITTSIGPVGSGSGSPAPSLGNRPRSLARNSTAFMARSMAGSLSRPAICSKDLNGGSLQGVKVYQGRVELSFEVTLLF